MWKKAAPAEYKEALEAGLEKRKSQELQNWVDRDWTPRALKSGNDLLKRIRDPFFGKV